MNSRYPNGETIEWHSDDSIAAIANDELFRCVRFLYAACLLLIHFPPKGKWNEANLCLVAMLVSMKWKDGDILDFLQPINEAIGNRKQRKKRKATIRSTRSRIEDGDTVWGIPKFKQLFGYDIAEAVLEALGIANQETVDTVKEQAREFTAADLQAKVFEPIQYLVNLLLPKVGLVVLGGKPKVGKSFLALFISLAVALGKKLFDVLNVEEGRVFYFALEDNAQRLQVRIKQILGNLTTNWPEKLHFVLDLEQLDKGGLDQIESYLDDHPDTVLIIIDTLARAGSTSTDYNYRKDYELYAPLQGIAQRFGICVMVIHHLRKASASDPLDQLSGTTALAGVADTLLVLTPTPTGEAILYGRGRDIEEFNYGVKLIDGRWEFLGPSELAGRTDTDKAILQTLSQFPEGTSPKTVSSRAGIPPEKVRKYLTRLAEDGAVRKLDRGVYVCNFDTSLLSLMSQIDDEK